MLSLASSTRSHHFTNSGNRHNPTQKSRQMKMKLLLSAVALSFTMVASAQTSSPQDQTPAQGSSAPQQQAPSSAGSQGITSETNARHLTGERTVVGCVVQSGDGYVLRTDEETFPINSDRDVTPYIGKRVKIVGTWQATGITTTAPVQGSSSSKPDKASAPDSKQSGAAFGGELRLQIIGTVIGQCDQSQK
jgi:Protein of unknown function (DUF5818)